MSDNITVKMPSNWKSLFTVEQVGIIKQAHIDYVGKVLTMGDVLTATGAARADTLSVNAEWCLNAAANAFGDNVDVWIDAYYIKCGGREIVHKQIALGEIWTICGDCDRHGTTTTYKA